MDCSKARRKIEAAAEDSPSVARHLRDCDACSARARRLAAPGRLLAGTAHPDAAALRQGLVSSVVARLEAGQVPRRPLPAFRWARPALGGVAAGLAAAVALLAGVELGSPLLAPIPSAAARAATEAPFTIVRDGDDVAIRFGRNGERVHRIALSTRPDFSTAKVTEFKGDIWRDPAPAPIVGGVVFYRVD